MVSILKQIDKTAGSLQQKGTCYLSFNSKPSPIISKTIGAESRRKLFGLESKTIVYEWLNINVPALIYFGVTITRLLEKG